MSRKTNNKKNIEICRCMNDDMWNDTFYVISCNVCSTSYHLKCIITDEKDLKEMIALYNDPDSSRSNIRLNCGFTQSCKFKSLIIRYGRMKRTININFNFDQSGTSNDASNIDNDSDDSQNSNDSNLKIDHDSNQNISSNKSSVNNSTDDDHSNQNISSNKSSVNNSRVEDDSSIDNHIENQINNDVVRELVSEIDELSLTDSIGFLRSNKDIPIFSCTSNCKSSFESW
jgi:hypothetical protein